MFYKIKGNCLLILPVFLFFFNTLAQDNILHPPDSMQVLPLGKNAQVEWVFEQPDTLLSYCEWIANYFGSLIY